MTHDESRALVTTTGSDTVAGLRIGVSDADAAWRAARLAGLTLDASAAEGPVDAAFGRLVPRSRPAVSASTSCRCRPSCSRATTPAPPSRSAAVTPPFRRVLVANRGEIAIRIFRALRELGCASVAVYSEADRDARHVRAADDARLIGPGTPAESYLSVDRIIAAARASGAEAIHRVRLPRRERRLRARVRRGGHRLDRAAGRRDRGDGLEDRVATADGRGRGAVVPGTTEQVTTAARVIELGEELGWPIAIKASSGGGGRGLKVVRGPDEASARSSRPSARARRTSPTAPSTSSATSTIRATSRSRCWPTGTAR